MESAIENRLQSGNSRSRTQESHSVSGKSSSFCVSPDILPPPPAAANATKMHGRPNDSSSCHHFFPISKQITSETNGTASLPIFGDKDNGCNGTLEILVTKPHFKKRDEADYLKYIFCDEFSEDTCGEEWSDCLTWNDWRHEECSEARNEGLFATFACSECNAKSDHSYKNTKILKKNVEYTTRALLFQFLCWDCL
jgi:hypothetical protein